MISKSRTLSVVIILSIAVAVTGCVKMLHLTYESMPGTDNRLTSVSPVKVKLGEFADKREGGEGPKLIGGIQEKVGSIVTDIQSDRTVSDIIREALRSELVRSGHSVVDDKEDVILNGEIRTFWLKTKVTKEDWDVIGEMKIVLEVVDSSSGVSSYLGPYYAKTTEKRYTVPEETVMTRVLEKSLIRLMKKIRSDADLATALEKK